MTSLVVSDQTLAALAHDAVLFLRTCHHPLNRIADLVVADLSQLAAGRQDCCFIEQIGEIRTGVTGGATGDLVQVNVLGQRLAAGMNVEDLQSAGVIGAVDGDLAIKTTRTHQRSIENIRAVGSRHDDDAGVAFEAIHLRQQLVEGLLPLVVATTKAGTTLTTNGVDLVNEDDAGGIFLGLLEQIAHAAGTDADEHLDELRA